HDEALAELRQVTDAMAEAARSPIRTAPDPDPGRSPAAAPGHADAPDDEGVYAIAHADGLAATEPGSAAGKPPRKRRNSEEDPGDPDRPANLRCERSDETGSMCLTWDGTPRKDLVFGVWRSVTRQDGPPGAFERLAMIRETGFIDTSLPADAIRVSYAVRAMVGRRPVPGSTHLCVPLGDPGS